MSDTIRVILKMPLFCPLGYFPKTESSREPSELPEAVRQYLPKSAIIVEEDAPRKPMPKKAEPDTMSGLSKAGKGSTLMDHLKETANS